MNWCLNTCPFFVTKETFLAGNPPLFVVREAQAGGSCVPISHGLGSVTSSSFAPTLGVAAAAGSGAGDWPAQHLAAHEQHPRIDRVPALGRRAVDLELRRQVAGGERLLHADHRVVPGGVVRLGDLLVFVAHLLERLAAAAQAIGVGDHQPVVAQGLGIGHGDRHHVLARRKIRQGAGIVLHDRFELQCLRGVLEGDLDQRRHLAPDGRAEVLQVDGLERLAAVDGDRDLSAPVASPLALVRI